jgi:hypothetical protein
MRGFRARQFPDQKGAQGGSAGVALAPSRARNRAGSRNDQVRRSFCASLQPTRDSGQTSPQSGSEGAAPARRAACPLPPDPAHLPSRRKPGQRCLAARDRVPGFGARAPTRASRRPSDEQGTQGPGAGPLSGSAQPRVFSRRRTRARPPAQDVARRDRPAPAARRSSTIWRSRMAAAATGSLRSSLDRHGARPGIDSGAKITRAADGDPSSHRTAGDALPSPIDRHRTASNGSPYRAHPSGLY